MDSLDLEVLKTCSAWLTAGKACELVTVVKTWGSSPRPAGAMLAIAEGGLVIGSVSGGCIEDDLIARVQEQGFTRSLPEMLTYGVHADDAHRFGLPCGGTIQLMIEPLSAKSQIDVLLAKLAGHELVSRTLVLATGEVKYSAAEAHQRLDISKDYFRTVHGPRWRLLIIGAGQLSRFLATIAIGMDYHVTVCDPREEYRDACVLEGVELVTGMPDDVVMEMRLDSRSAVVALTHDPKLDDMALIEALKSPAFYVGAIGSRSNNAKRRERLKLFELSDEEIAKLHGPIGIYIGSKTPAEIAISILAEMTAIKNHVALRIETQIEFAKANQVGDNGANCALP